MSRDPISLFNALAKKNPKFQNAINRIKNNENIETICSEFSESWIKSAIRDLSYKNKLENTTIDETVVYTSDRNGKLYKWNAEDQFFKIDNGSEILITNGSYIFSENTYDAFWIGTILVKKDISCIQDKISYIRDETYKGYKKASNERLEELYSFVEERQPFRIIRH